MEKDFKPIFLRINNYLDRKTIAAALLENGYTISVINKQHRDNVYEFDYFILITAQPVFPDYYEK